MRIDIKALSVNDAWKGRRFKTDSYKVYEKSVHYLLKNMNIPEGDLELCIEWGLSNEGSDWDNPIKPFQDCLQKKYGFDDKRVIEAHVRKRKVKKKEEYIRFIIRKHRGYVDWEDWIEQ